MIIGENIAPKKIPNLNHILFNGVNKNELNIPRTRKIIEIIKDQNLISPSLNNGHIEIIKKTAKNTTPKLLFVPILGFILFYFIF
tara:strand:- start:149 stop:403 length:255 start_codon:yes stop_codon:yes gene_type:complete